SETDENQLLLFTEKASGEEKSSDENIANDAQVRIAGYSRKKPGRKPIPESIPREEVVNLIIPELSATYSGGKLPPDRALFLAYRVAGLKSRNICHLS
ncbi:MAG TPA: transposase, partial [Atopostipes sp.]|nr:transposase [Atopostipes sp.]